MTSVNNSRDTRNRYPEAPSVVVDPTMGNTRSGEASPNDISPHFSPDLVTKAPSVWQIGPHVAMSDEA